MTGYNTATGGDSLENYRAALDHIVRPENPAERREATSITIEDWEALSLIDDLHEFGRSTDLTATENTIALGYAEYINKVVREEGSRHVTLYVHTNLAESLLLGLLSIPTDVSQRLYDKCVVEFFEGDR